MAIGQDAESPLLRSEVVAGAAAALFARGLDLCHDTTDTRVMTRTLTISQPKADNIGGSDYLAQFLGTRIVFTDWEGARHHGAIESFGVAPGDDRGGQYPIARLDDGRWARLSYTVTLEA